MHLLFHALTFLDFFFFFICTDFSLLSFLNDHCNVLLTNDSRVPSFKYSILIIRVIKVMKKLFTIKSLFFPFFTMISAMPSLNTHSKKSIFNLRFSNNFTPLILDNSQKNLNSENIHSYSYLLTTVNSPPSYA